MRGRPTKDTEVLKAQGTYKKIRHDKRLVVAPLTDIPHPPDGYDSEASRLWYEVCSMLTQNGILASTDVHSIAQYCEVTLLEKEAKDTIKREGMFIQVTTGQGELIPKEHPANALIARYAGIRHGLMDRFGCSPKARQGLKT